MGRRRRCWATVAAMSPSEQDYRLSDRHGADEHGGVDPGNGGKRAAAQRAQSLGATGYGSVQAGDPVRAENPVRSSDQQSCSPAVRPR